MKSGVIAVVVVATNAYNKNLGTLLPSINEHFVPDADKNIYLFSDREPRLQDHVPTRMSFYRIEHKPWPHITLARYKFICGIAETLRKAELVVYIDADMFFCRTVKIPALIKDKEFFAVRHPWYPDLGGGPFETRQELSCSLPPEEVKRARYFQACFWGGKSGFILDRCQRMSFLVEKDTTNGFVAIWEDESYFNHMTNEFAHLCNELPPSFAHPGHWKKKPNAYICHLNNHSTDSL